MIHLDLQPEVEARLAAEAEARGLALDRYVEKLVTTSILDAPPYESPAAVVAAIREGRKGMRLDGLKIADMIREGRKF